MTRGLTIGVAALALSVTAPHPADALPKSSMTRLDTAIGCTVYVHPSVVGKFREFFELLHRRVGRVPCSMVNCWSGGGHVRGSNHYWGGACDVQSGRNRGPRFIHHMDDIIREAGLHSGCRFRDCGHVEALTGLYNAPGSVRYAGRRMRLRAATRDLSARRRTARAVQPVALPDRTTVAN